MVTAPGSGAEIIPFLKTWVGDETGCLGILYQPGCMLHGWAHLLPITCSQVNLPMAIMFTIGYAKVRTPHTASMILPSAAAASLGAHGPCNPAFKCLLPSQPPLCLPALQLANVLSSEALFYACIIPFIIFFGCFATFMYPLRDVLHPTGALMH